MPIAQLRAVVDRFEANAIFTPSLEHFEDQEPPAELIAVADVITVHDGHTYAQLNTSI
ncbi:hypothetical protein [Nocardia macrotermitis]|uniref:Uncharacterized protein n=1 Tax=Nocardia macrotermitis TaxID=2585198 RepID=A0A7K0D0V0_9NOCA|nr:hypothetical protein [Nocardia macrotermitis]MQY19349.1 hypothetical protein [Nocardia macrotermitis]